MAKKPRTRVITDFNDDSEDISKTERKQMAADLRDFAKMLTELPKTKLQQMELPQVFWMRLLSPIESPATLQKSAIFSLWANY